MQKIIEQLSERYGFDKEEAKRYIESKKVKKEVKVVIEEKIIEEKEVVIEEKEVVIEEKEVVIEKKIPLPFNGEIKEECCQGVEKNHGLYTQCMKERKKGNERCQR